MTCITLKTGTCLKLGPGVGSYVVVEHHQQEEGHSQHVGEDGQLDVSYHGRGGALKQRIAMKRKLDF